VDRRIKIESALETRSGMLVPDWSRRFIRGASRGCKVRFSQGVIIDPAVDAEAGATCGSKYGSAEEESFGATRDKRNRRRRTTKDPGRLGNLLDDEAKQEQLEQSRGSSEATGWRWIRGDSDSDQPVPEMRNRGNSEPDRRRYRGRRAKGQPGAFTTGTAER